MGKIIKCITLETEDLEFLKLLAKKENRNFSNTISTVIKRYKKMMEQLDQGMKIDAFLSLASDIENVVK